MLINDMAVLVSTDKANQSLIAELDSVGDKGVRRICITLLGWLRGDDDSVR